MTTKTRTSRGGRRTRKAPPRTGTKSPTSTTSTRSPASSSRRSSPDRATFTADELARQLGVDRKTVYEGAARGEIPSVRIGRRLLFPRVAIDTWLSATPTRRGTMRAPTRSLPRKEVTKQ